MVDPVVRRATADDAGQLAELEREAHATLAVQRGGLRWLETHPERGQAWADHTAGGRVHAAVIGDVIVGYLVASHHGPIGRVDEVYVTPEAREVGFGDALLEAAVTDARADGCSAIEGEALPGDRETKNLYERAGITARLIVLARQI